MSTVITTTQRARRDYRCSVCLEIIFRGELYERTASTPKDDVYNTGRWDHLFAHAPYGACLMSGMTQAQPSKEA
jgi:hypothetical protein